MLKYTRVDHDLECQQPVSCECIVGSKRKVAMRLENHFMHLQLERTLRDSLT